MKLLFAYFDCDSPEAVGAGRGLGEQSLNFSTEYDFAVRKELLAGNNGTYYWLSSKWKPEEERIPAGFWSNRISEKQSYEKRIYNVSALVGSNGSGKSTLLHSLIKTLVEGLDPGIPFLLVLRETGNTEPYVYSNINRLELQEEDGLKFKKPSRDYPEALRRAKIMLIDNTLSVSAMELDRSCERLYPTEDSYQEEPEPDPIPEGHKQLINKSLFASIRYSCDVSSAKRYDPSYSVKDGLGMYFRYETYQELRFLFDKFQRKMIEDLRSDWQMLPLPGSLYVSFYGLDELSEIYQLRQRKLHRALAWVKEKKPENVLESLYQRIFFCMIERGFGFSSDLEESLGSAAHWPKPDRAEEMLETAFSRPKLLIRPNNSNDAEQFFSDCERFFKHIRARADTMKTLFQPVRNTGLEGRGASGEKLSSRQTVYRVDIEKTVEDPSLTNCFMTFLDLYRKVSNWVYFLSFSAGLSSGEKNLLRMLTQLRYALDGPAVYAEDADEDNTGSRLWNAEQGRSNGTRRRGVTCDTFILLLDEADLTYHPEWQRKLVGLLCAALPRMFKEVYNKRQDPRDGCKDIQVILATHSPLMLGDFPKASTVYLDAGSSGEAGESPAPGSSFGQNLYTILRNGFFMEDSLGEFAKRKINDAAAWCANVRKLAAQEKKLKKKREQSLDKNCESSQEEQRRKELGELKQRRDILKLDLEVHKATARLLSPGIIREKLLLELAECETLLGETRQNKRLEREALERKKQLLREKLKEAELELQALEEDDE